METPTSRLGLIKLWCILPALQHCQNGRGKLRERFASVEHCTLTLLLPWLMYSRRKSTRQSGLAPEATDADMFKRASSACRHLGGVTVTTSRLLAEQRAPGSEEASEQVRANYRTRIGSWSPKQQRERWRQVPPTRKKGVVLSSTPRKSSTHMWPSRSSTFAPRYQAREATACAFRAYGQ